MPDGASSDALAQSVTLDVRHVVRRASNGDGEQRFALF